MSTTIDPNAAKRQVNVCVPLAFVVTLMVLLLILIISVDIIVCLEETT
jgi:hypothetical protein